MARGYFDPTRLSSADAQRHHVLHSAERTEEFIVSRSLQQYLAVPDTTAQSLSHSGKHAAVILAPQRLAVGIDLEQHRSRDLRAIARFAFSAEESAALETAADGPELELAFYTRWVMKEALAKALRLPLLEAARECSFVAHGHDWNGRVPCSRPWCVTTYRPRPDMSLAIAVVGEGGESLPVRCYEWPPPRRADWPAVARLASTVYASRKTALLEESSTCRAMLPTS